MHESRALKGGSFYLLLSSRLDDLFLSCSQTLEKYCSVKFVLNDFGLKIERLQSRFSIYHTTHSVEGYKN